MTSMNEDYVITIVGQTMCETINENFINQIITSHNEASLLFYTICIFGRQTTRNLRLSIQHLHGKSRVFRAGHHHDS